MIHLARVLKYVSTIRFYFKQYLKAIFQVGRDIICILFNGVQKLFQFISNYDTKIGLLPECEALFDLIWLYWMKIIL